MLPVLTLFRFFHFFTDSLLFAILPICPVFTVFPALESVVTRISDHFTGCVTPSAELSGAGDGVARLVKSCDQLQLRAVQT